MTSIKLRSIQCRKCYSVCYVSCFNELSSPVLNPVLANCKICLYDPEKIESSEIVIMYGLKPESKTLLSYLIDEKCTSKSPSFSCCNNEGIRFSYKVWPVPLDNLHFAQIFIVPCHDDYDLGMFNATRQLYLGMLGNLTAC